MAANQKQFSTKFHLAAKVVGTDDFVRFGDELKRLSGTSQELANKFKGLDGSAGIRQSTQAVKEAKGGFESLSASVEKYRFGILAITAATAGFVQTLQRVLQVQQSIDQLDAVLNFVNDGDTRQTAQNIDYLRETTDRLGLSFSKTSELYGKMAAAAKISGFTASENQKIFESFSGAIARLNLSADSSNRIFFALQQMMSKGTVMSEELKGQLGEKLVGAFGLAADALDVTTEQLSKMLENGEVLARDLLPKMADEINKTFGLDSTTRIDTATASMNRFNNAVDELQRAIVGSGIGDAIAASLESAAVAIKAISDNFGTLATLVGGVVLGRLVKLGAGMYAVEMASRAKTAAQIAETRATLANVKAVQAGILAEYEFAAAKRASALAAVKASTSVGAYSGAIFTVQQNQKKLAQATKDFSSANEAAARVAQLRQATEAKLADQVAKSAAKSSAAFGLLRTGASRTLALLGGPWVAGVTLAATLGYEAYEFFARRSTSALSEVDNAAKLSTSVREINSQAIVDQLDREIAKYKELNAVVASAPTATDLAKKELELITQQIQGLQQNNVFNGQVFDPNTQSAAIQDLLSKLGAQYGFLSSKIAEAEAEQAKFLKAEYLEALGKYEKKLSSADKAVAELRDKFGALFTPEDEKKVRKYFETVSKASEKATEEVSEATKHFIEQQKQLARSYDASIESVEKQIKSAQEESQTIGLTREQLNKLELAKLSNLIADKELRAEALRRQGTTTLELALLDDEIAKLKDLKDAKAGLFKKQELQSQADALSKQFKQAHEEITKGLTDSLVRGFENGKSLIDSFGDYIKNYFKSLVIKFAVQPVIGSIVGSVLGTSAGSALAGLGGGGGAAGVAGSIGANSTAGSVLSIGSSISSLIANGKTAYSAVTGAFTNFAGTLEAAGDFLATNFQGVSNAVADFGLNLGDFAFKNADAINTVSTAAGSLAAVYGGVQLGRAVSGGFAIGGGTGNSAVNIGTALGFVAGGPLGAIIGGALGGVANRAFGRKAPQLVGSGLQGEFTAEGFEGQTFADFFQKGGFFRSNRSFTVMGELAEETSTAINEYMRAVSDAAVFGSKAIFADAEQAIANFSESGRFAGNLEQILTKIGDQLYTAVIPNLEDFQLENEKLAETFGRVVASVRAANDAALLLGQTTQFSADNIEAALSLNTQGLEFFFENFVSDAEQAERTLALFNEQLRVNGLESTINANTTRDQFAALVEGLDLTTEAGQRELANLLAVAPLFDKVLKAREAEIALLEQAEQAQIDLLKAIVDAADQAFLSVSQARDRVLGTTPTDSFGSIMSDIANAETVAQLLALKDRTLEYFDAQTKVKEALEQSAKAAEDNIAAIEDRIIGIQSQATGEYIAAQERVAQAQQNIADLQAQAERDRQRDLAQAYQQSADSIRGLLDSLRDPQQSFNSILQAALGGDLTALNTLPQVAQQALQSIEGVSALDEARQRAVILSGLEQAAQIAEQNAFFDEGPSAIDLAQQELANAQSALAQALEQANLINAPLAKAQQTLVEQYTLALGELSAANDELNLALGALNTLQFQDESLSLLQMIEQQLNAIRVDAIQGQLGFGVEQPISVTPLPRITFEDATPTVQETPFSPQLATTFMPQLQVAQSSAPIFNQSDSSMVRELAALRAELAALRSEQRIGHQQIALNTGKVAKVIERVDDGDAITVRVDA